MRGHTLVALALCTLAACGKDGSSPASPSPPPGQNAPVVYAAIGASDALGIGASVPCIPFVPCPDGTGYVPIIARRLSETRTVTTTNLGIPAAVIGPEIQRLGLDHGRTIPGNFIDNEVPFVPRDATLVTIFAGGNDANAIGAAVEGGAGGSDPGAFLDAQIRQFGASYDALVGGIRERAPAARIVAANLPNLAGAPYASGYSLARRQVLQRVSVGFSTEVVNRLVNRQVIVVDLLCDGRAYDPANYSSDGFHPDDSGYAFMADLFVDAILRGTPVTPPARCPQMSVVPPL